MIKVDENKILKKIKDMSPEEAATLVKDALNMAGIEYKEGTRKIIFGGLRKEEK